MSPAVRRWLAVIGLLVVAGLDGAAAARLQRHASLPGDLVGVVPLVVAIDIVAAVAAGAVAGGATWAWRRWRRTEARGVPEAGAAFGLLAGLLAIDRWPELGEAWQARAVVAAVLGLGAALGRVRGGLAVVGLAAVGLGTARLAALDAHEREAPVAGTARGGTVVLLTLDTLRADHVGAIGGYGRAVETPNLDALARRGALFTEGVSPVPLTLPSHGAMLTGVSPDEAGLLRNGGALLEGVPTVAERFAAAGFRTGAFVSAVVLRDTTGLDRGFQVYDDRVSLVDRLFDGLAGVAWRRLRLSRDLPRERRGDRTVRRALRWLAAEPGPSFLWVHLYDPHAPYAPPQPWDRHYDASAPDAPGNPDEVKASLASRPEGAAAGPDMVVGDLRRMVAAYAGEVSWTDQVVGALLVGLPADAALVVASDHGESLTEHGYLLNHGSEVYQVSVRVPIIVVAPGQVAAGTVVARPAPLTDVAATLLTLAGLPADGPGLVEQVPHADAAEFELSQPDEVPPPSAGDPTHDDAHVGPIGPFEIRSYAPAQESRWALGRKKHWRVAWRTGNEKWIVSDDGRVQRFDLAADPAELLDLAGDGQAAEAMRARGLAEIERLQRLRTELSEQQAGHLQALGYVTE